MPPHQLSCDPPNFMQLDPWKLLIFLALVGPHYCPPVTQNHSVSCKGQFVLSLLIYSIAVPFFSILWSHKCFLCKLFMCPRDDYPATRLHVVTIQNISLSNHRLQNSKADIFLQSMTHSVVTSYNPEDVCSYFETSTRFY
jgi:hypothetical protein